MMKYTQLLSCSLRCMPLPRCLPSAAQLLQAHVLLRLADAEVRQSAAAGRPRGFAFAQFESEEAMHQACQALDGGELLKRALNLRPMGMEQGQPAQSVATCWFCLSNEQSDKRLVISVGAQLDI